MTQRSDIATIKSKLSLVDIAKRFMELKRAGGRWVAPCPFHQETKPSFSINEEEGVFYCFGADVDPVTSRRTPTLPPSLGVWFGGSGNLWGYDMPKRVPELSPSAVKSARPRTATYRRHVILVQHHRRPNRPAIH